MICDECETVAHCLKNGCVPKTIKKDEVLRLALEALEKIGMRGWVERKEEAITALREALAEQPAQPKQENYMDNSHDSNKPVAWQVEMFIAGEWVPLGNPQRSKTKAEALASNPSLPKEHQRLFPVYTSPPAQRKPLTDDEMYFAIRPLFRTDALATAALKIGKDEYRAIEAAHGIKENT